MGYALRTFHGAVVRFWPERGFGFVKPDGMSRDARVHLTDCEGIGGDQISVGTRLQFYLVDHPKGLRAIRVSME
jgi:cold shock CspA family protein